MLRLCLCWKSIVNKILLNTTRTFYFHILLNNSKMGSTMAVSNIWHKFISSFQGFFQCFIPLPGFRDDIAISIVLPEPDGSILRCRIRRL